MPIRIRCSLCDAEFHSDLESREHVCPKKKIEPELCVCKFCAYCYLDGGRFMVCRRHSPITVPVTGLRNVYRSMWPEVESFYWCGDWKKDDRSPGLRKSE